MKEKDIVKKRVKVDVTTNLQSNKQKEKEVNEIDALLDDL
jgi:hypothetical protein